MKKTKNILIIGNDGYIGFPLTIQLLAKGHRVAGLDNGLRRQMTESVGSKSLTPIVPIHERHEKLKAKYKNYEFFFGSTMDFPLVDNLLKEFQPDVIYHLGEQPSAPYSQMDNYGATATQANNVIGTLNVLWAMKHHKPDAHLIKLGSMGEYGTQGDTIPELDFKYHKEPGSFYHLSKVHDSYNINFCTRIWDFRCTDIMQGVVYGLIDTKEDELTRFDYDESFGTAINRFMAQSVVGVPLTVYGQGGQKRGFLPLQDSLNCLEIVMENPAKKGEHRIINQFEEVYSINELAQKVANITGAEIKTVKNPRKEKETHEYEVVHEWLESKGYEPTRDMDRVIKETIGVLKKYQDRINTDVILPRISWE